MCVKIAGLDPYSDPCHHIITCKKTEKPDEEIRRNSWKLMMIETKTLMTKLVFQKSEIKKLTFV